MKINFFKKEKNLKTAKESPSLNINLYWKLSVCVVFLATAVSLVFGYFLFMGINDEQVVPPSNIGGQVETVKKESIDKVLLYFSAREEKSSQILNSPSPVVDPSL